jgi:hypothetical protein
MLDILKEPCSFARVVPELVAEDSESARSVTESPSDIARIELIDKEGAQGFVLALQGFFRGKEEAGIGGFCYLIAISDRHGYIMLQNNSPCQDIVHEFLAAPTYGHALMRC